MGKDVIRTKFKEVCKLMNKVMSRGILWNEEQYLKAICLFTLHNFIEKQLSQQLLVKRNGF